jgi:predicted chitinase
MMGLSKRVETLQKKLEDLDLYDGGVDGDFGDETLAATLKGLEAAAKSVCEPEPKIVTAAAPAPAETPDDPAVQSALVADRSAFYDEVRDDLGVLSQSQVEGFETLLQVWADSKLTDDRWFAYMLATAWHETGRAMKPVTEDGGDRYLRRKPYYPYIGRGYVQLTWKANYKKYGIDKTPLKALEPKMAAHIMVDGMVNGIFTGRKLSNYFNDKVNNPIGARYIINGTDQAKKIAGYHKTFVEALAALKATPVSPKA